MNAGGTLQMPSISTTKARTQKVGDILDWFNGGETDLLHPEGPTTQQDDFGECRFMAS